MVYGKEASSLNIGYRVEKITRGMCSANIGELELNSLIFQDDIAKMTDAKPVSQPR